MRLTLTPIDVSHLKCLRPLTCTGAMTIAPQACVYPMLRQKNFRIENRFPGADINPYLAIAATLACGYLGMKNKIQPSAAFEGNAYEEDMNVPRTLEEALRGLKENQEIIDIFGERFIQLYTSIKLVEFEEFNRVISSWEREHLLLNV